MKLLTAFLISIFSVALADEARGSEPAESLKIKVSYSSLICEMDSASCESFAVASGGAEIDFKDELMRETGRSSNDVTVQHTSDELNRVEWILSARYHSNDSNEHGRSMLTISVKEKITRDGVADKQKPVGSINFILNPEQPIGPVRFVSSPFAKHATTEGHEHELLSELMLLPIQ